MDSNTLITLYPKGMIVEVKKSFNLSYRMEKSKFTVLFLLAISHPHIVTYQEVSEILESVEIEIKEVTKINKLVSKLKNELKSYGVKNLIINVKGIGYGISNKWVEPSGIISSKKEKGFLEYFRKLSGIATLTKN